MMGGACDTATSQELINLFKAKTSSSQPYELDTARMYCGGKTEQILGDYGVTPHNDQIQIATKVNPWFGSPNGEPRGGLSKENMEVQMNASLKALKLPRVSILYLHAPDHATPLEETLEKMNELHQRGLYDEFGLSNYSAWQVADIVHLCRGRGWVGPSVYQGMYNCLTREIEAELLPCCRHFNLRFYAYNPLAGGLLSGKHSLQLDTPPSEGRFTGDTAAGRMYRARFWKQSYMDSIGVAAALCPNAGTSLPNAALRWLVHHSKLDAAKGDAVILGGSSLEHVAGNISACQEGPLEGEGGIAVRKAFDEGWSVIKGNCPLYFR